MAALSATDITRVIEAIQGITEVAEGDSVTTVVMGNGRTVPTISKVIADSQKFKGPAIVWVPALSVTDALQTYTESNIVYAPQPEQLPFTTAGAFEGASHWYVVQGYVSGIGALDVGGHFLPTADSLYDVGNNGLRFNKGWFDNLDVTTGQMVDLDLTGGLSFDGNSDKISIYEVGTFVPVVQGSTTAGINTYSAQTGNHVRIGKLVFISLVVSISTIDAAMAGDIEVVGLPFGNFQDSIVLSVRVNGFDYPGTRTWLVGNLGSSAIKIFALEDGSTFGDALGVAEINQATIDIIVSGCYMAT